MQISVIVPSYNSAKTIRQTLDGLLGQRNRERLLAEIIVVDSSDDSETKAILDRYARRESIVRIIDAGVKVIPAIGRNIGAREATAAVVAFVDSDAYPAEDWLQVISDAFAGGVKVGGGSYGLPPFQVDSKIATAQYYLQFNEFLPAGESRVKEFTPSCNLFCDKSIFLESGGFPEIRAAEDVMFGLGISQKYQFVFVPNALVFHIFREDMAAFRNNQFLLGKYIVKYRKRHYGSLIYKGIFPLLLLPGFLLVKLKWIYSRISAAGIGHRNAFFRCLDLFLLGLLSWSLGFAAGVFEKFEGEI